MGTMIRVGMADLNVCKSPDAITTIGLGSCVGIVLYDEASGKCGLAHIMLPSSKQISNNSNIAKFADSGIDELIRRLSAMGVPKYNLKAKIAGGAQMFALSGINNNIASVGDRNVAAVKEKLEKELIPITAEDTGNNYGRTIEFYPEMNKLLVKAVGKEPVYI